ncbi:lyase family protein [Pseudaestuariivita sp.]|uniref:lyase family protein n=1 Tax=Pseudaestuariivita sp. TaxID=2211669 RepID=UPI0040598DF0
MLPGLTTSTIYGPLYGDAEVARCLDDAALVVAMIAVERAYAQAQGVVGMIPQEAAGQLADVLGTMRLAPQDLAAGTSSAGVPVPALVAALRKELPEDLGQWLHYGATSQDIIDTAQVLMCREALHVILPRLHGLIDRLEALARDHRDTLMAGRTRAQVSTPITFGLRAARWAQPLIAAEADAERMLGALSRVQCGGASGANSAIAPHGRVVSAAMAEVLGLNEGPSWHTDRTPFLTLGSWVRQVLAGLEKMAKDVITLQRSELAEVSGGGAGGSSTMPHKANPVQAEAILVLSQLGAQADALLGAAASPMEERDGALWPLEWSALPQLLVALGSAVRHAGEISANLVPDAAVMRARIDASPGIMAEAASFALAPHMSREAAKARVQEALAIGRPLAEVCAEADPALLDPAAVLPACHAEAEAVLAARTSWRSA